MNQTCFEREIMKRCLCEEDCKIYPCPALKELEKTETTIMIGVRIIRPAVKKINTTTGQAEWVAIKKKSGKNLKLLIVDTLESIEEYSDTLKTIDKKGIMRNADGDKINETTGELIPEEDEEVGGDATTPQE